jgi:hypothetical protein
LVFCTTLLTGCPGTLDASFTPTGGGGNGGGMAGAAGGATGPIVPNPPPGFDITPLFIGPSSTYKCTESTICHDAMGGGAANFTMTGDWIQHLIGVVPKGGGTPASICGADTNFKGMPYIKKGDPNGDGLFLQKLTAPVCMPGGSQMPFAMPPVSASDLANIKKWLVAMAALQ